MYDLEHSLYEIKIREKLKEENRRETGGCPESRKRGLDWHEGARPAHPSPGIGTTQIDKRKKSQIIKYALKKICP